MPSTTLPLRTALIGLSANAVTSWASAAHLPGLLSPTGRSKLQITALLNSSVDAAHAAIKKYNLPDNTKAYGSPADLAADSEVDLVICTTRVDKHYETILPSVKAGKDVFVEWPVAAKLGEIDDLVKIAKESGSRVAVGLQRRWAPPVVKMRELLAGGKGKLGKVLSVDVHAFGGTMDREILPPGLKYFAQREVGGNPIVIGFGHLFDFVLSVVGEVDPKSLHSKAQLQRPEIRVRDPSTKEIVETITSDVPDLLTVHGTLTSPEAIANATISLLFRRGQPFPGAPSFIWTINCERGEIRLTSPSTSLSAGANEEPVKIQVHNFDTNKVEEVAFDWSERQKELPGPARDVSETLYAFSEGKEEGNGWVGLESAAVRAKMIEGFLN